MQFEVHRSPTCFSIDSDVTVEKVQQLLKDALDFAYPFSLRSVQRVLEQVEQALPTGSNLDFAALAAPYLAGADTRHFVDSGGHFRVTFLTESNHSTNPAQRRAKIVLPAIFGIPFQVEDRPRTPDLLLFLYTEFHGTIAQDCREAQDAGLVSQVDHLLRTIHDVLKSVVTNTTYNTLEELTDHAVSMLKDQRDLFSAIVITQKVRVKAQIRTRERGVRVFQSVTKSATVATLTEETPEEDEEFMTRSYDGRAAEENIYVALGSNVGDRLQNIENACNELDAEPDIRVLRSSALYETTPMYVEDQDRFLNGVCEVSLPFHQGSELQLKESDRNYVGPHGASE